jgi:small subunit ribosomal protein S15
VLQMEKNQHAIREVMAKFQRHPGDTGSSEVQIAILTERIKYMTKHVQEHRKDRHNNKGLVQMVHGRRKLLKYLKV